MKRTPQDFVDEAKEQDPYELDLGGKVIKPRSRHHFTHDETLQVARNQAAYLKYLEDKQAEPPSDPSDPAYIQPPFDLDLDLRFGKDRAAFWKVWGTQPVPRIAAMIAELDNYYDPTPASDKEKADGAADPDGETAGKSSGASAS